MTNTFFDVILVVLAVIGIIEIVREIIKFASAPKNTDSVLILPFSGHIEDIEFIVRTVAVNSHCKKGGENTTVICLDKGMDEETKKLCECVCGDYDFVFLSEENELNTFLNDVI